MSLPAILAAARPSTDGFVVSIPPEWHQGRTAYGGLSSALALVAATRAGGEGLPPLRSMQVSMIAPLFGEVAAAAQVIRRGKNATWIEVRLTRDGETGLVASFVFMAPVASALHLDECPMPAGVVPLDDAVPLPAGRGATFLQNQFDVRFARPQDQARRPEFAWWVRARHTAGLEPMVGLVLCADALPPGVMPMMAALAPVSSMHWQAGLLTPAPVTRDGWWLLQSTGDYAERGCSTQTMRVWNADGEPVMAGQQSVALFG